MPAVAAAARKAAAGTKAAPVDVTEVEDRSLDTNDRIFGVIDGGLSTGEGSVMSTKNTTQTRTSRA